MRNQIKNHFLLFCIIITAMQSHSLANQYTLRSVNPGFENGMTGWVPSGDYPTVVGTIEQRDWTPDPTSPSEAQLGQSFFKILPPATSPPEAIKVGFGQYVTLDPNAKRQVLACNGFNDGGWAGYGITYYDASWNELEIYRQEIGPRDDDLTRGNGDGMRPQSLGCEVPESAVFAYIWFWQESTFITIRGPLALHIDRFALYDFAPADPDNLITNGNFTTGNVDAASDSPTNPSVRLNGLEFWEFNGIFETVGLRMLWNAAGQFMEVSGSFPFSLMYQRVPLAEAKDYTFSITASREDVVDLPGAVGGIDYFDANGNKLGATPVIEMRDTLPTTQSRTFTTPTGTAYGYTWIWMESSIQSGALRLNEIRLEENLTAAE